MKIQKLKHLAKSEIFAHLLTLQRIAPEYGKDIIYKSNYWDGILSGTLRWNGAILYFNCVMDEYDFAMPRSSEPWDCGDEFEPATEGTRRYYAVVARSGRKTKQMIRRAISFRRNVNPSSDYRYLERHKGTDKINACEKPHWRSWYDRSWPAGSDEPYDDEVIAWFTL